MEFICETIYDAKALTAAARVARKTVGKTADMVLRAGACAFCVMALMGVVIPAWLGPKEGETMSVGILLVGVFVVTAVDLFIVWLLVFGDSLEGRRVSKRLQPGTERAVAVFTEENLTVATEIDKQEFSYNAIHLIAETTDYFVVVIGEEHAEIFSKSGISKGTVEDFRSFIQQKANIEIISVK